MKSIYRARLHARSGPPAVMIAWIVFMSLAGMSCTRITVPPHDNTPPTVALTLLAEDIETRSEGSPATVEVDQYDSYTMMVFGRDEDSGVRRAWIEGQVSVGCVLGGGGVIRHPSLPLRGHNSDIMEDIAEPGEMARVTLAQSLDWRTSEWLVFGGCSPYEMDYSMHATYVGFAENQHGAIVNTAPLTLAFETEESEAPPVEDGCDAGRSCTIQPWQCGGRPGFEVTGTTVCLEGFEQCQVSMPADYCSIAGGRCGRGEGHECDSEHPCAPGMLCVGAAGSARCHVGHCEIPANFCWTEDEVGDASLVCEEIG